ncbi:hypothetical protein A3D77_02340 [Candidatus Gottesmanbacteria bacterium RIFCSPHIGHO2_02_FULL_39_11]|uniref:Glycosyl transferase family 1 domain-containing protein n=1 Tax=Candidatus Gottesmanbacteria bacterium RIFCSPHIGHO2_02_FULL_39_11 TaxID=1798382 RepID=A0A1F5ZUW7_9BACT|nr:MAG: hypothetical protein A3D77_02340 [Candidatus Gottesmanbacteria bacterium RIFCSPHIGHO2_02_FULL_39_11]
MRIGIDSRLYYQTGVGRYIRNLILELSKIPSGNEYYIYLRKKEFEEFVPPSSQFVKRLVDLPWHGVKEQIVIPSVLKKDKVTVAHFPYFNVPIFYRGRYLLTIHDLILDHFNTGRASTLAYPLYRLKRFGYQVSLSQGIRNASFITTISETTKKEVMDHYGVNPSKIEVTYDALDEHFKSLVSSQKNVKPIFSMPYILYVGNAYPHKNLEKLLEAFKLLIKNKKIKLVLAGDDSFFYPRLSHFAQKLSLQDSVIFYGLANDSQLLSLYKYAKLLVFPSLMEGFGLPTFEALSCGVLPVVSDIPVFREIWKGDLLYFDPSKKESMAQVLKNALSLKDEEYKKRVIQAKKNIDRFSFKKTAHQTLKIYQQIAGS